MSPFLFFFFFFLGGELPFFPSPDTKHTLTSLLPRAEGGWQQVGPAIIVPGEEEEEEEEGWLQHVRPVSKTLAEEEKRGEALGGQDGRLVFSPTLSTFLLQLFLSRTPTAAAPVLCFRGSLVQER